MDVEKAFRLINEDFEPREHQKKCWELLDDDSPGIVLLSGTGSGKTEAILIPALFKNKRLVMIYPTRSLVNDQINRVRDYVRVLVSNGALSKTVILDLGDEQYSLKFTPFKKDEVIKKIESQIKFWEDTEKLKQVKLVSKNQEEILDRALDVLEEKLDSLIANFKYFDLIFSYGPYTVIEVEENKRGRFFVEKSKKHYYGGDVILTTIDKFLYRFFGYGEKRWNLIYSYRLYMGEESRDRLVICFDEAHTYDGVSYTNFINLLSTLTANGIKPVVMSATLPEEFVDLAKQKFGMIFVRGGDYKGEKTYEILDVGDEERNRLIGEIIGNNLDKKIIVVRNTVIKAFDTYNSLEKYTHNNTPLYFYHGRLFSFRKTRIYNELKERDERNEPYVLVTTHAIEVGCDLNADLLITDFCNPDQLIQRAGRCARIKGSKGKMYILGEEFLETDSFLKEYESFDYDKYIQILRDNNKRMLPEEEIRRKVIKHNLRKDELTDALFHFLFSYVYEYDRSKEELHNSGIIVTRSWIPSVKLFWLRKEANLKEIRRMCNEMSISDIIEKLREDNLTYNYEPISISLDTLVAEKKESKLTNKVLIVATEDSETLRYVKENINPYLSDIYCFYQSLEFPNINPANGLIRIPKILQLERKRGMANRLTLKKQISLADRDVSIVYLSECK